MVISYDVERNVEYLADIRLCVCNSRKTADVLRIFDPVMIPRYRHLDNTYNETQDVLTKTYHVLLFWSTCYRQNHAKEFIFISCLLYAYEVSNFQEYINLVSVPILIIILSAKLAMMKHPNNPCDDGQETLQWKNHVGVRSVSNFMSLS